MVAGLQSSQRFQVADPLQVNHPDVVRLQIQFGRLDGNSARNFRQLVARASHHGARAGARGRAIVFAQAALIRIAEALELVMWDLADRHVTHLERSRTTGRRTGQAALPQPLGEPAQVTVAVERVRG